MNDKFFDPQSIMTLGGASFAIVVVSATARKLFRLDTPWFAFIVAMAITLGGAYHAGTLKGLFQFFLAFINGCLVFFTALGLNETVAQTVNKPAPGNVSPQSARPKRWIQSMFRRPESK